MMTTAASSMTPSDIDSSPADDGGVSAGWVRRVRQIKWGAWWGRHHQMCPALRLAWQNKYPVGDEDHHQAGCQSQIWQHACFAFAHVAFLEPQIRQRRRREAAAILNIMAERKDRQDQRGKDEAHP